MAEGALPVGCPIASRLPDLPDEARNYRRFIRGDVLRVGSDQRRAARAFLNRLNEIVRAAAAATR